MLTAAHAKYTVHRLSGLLLSGEPLRCVHGHPLADNVMAPGRQLVRHCTYRARRGGQYQDCDTWVYVLERDDAGLRFVAEVSAEEAKMIWRHGMKEADVVRYLRLDFGFCG